MSLNEVKGLGNHLARYIGSSTFYNALDLDRVRIKSDYSQFVNHTVYLDDYDGDPYTFNNLVIGKDSLGNYQPPYILRYEPTDAFRRAYFNTGLLIGFEGKIIKYTLGVSGADGIKLRPPNHDPTEGDDGLGENNNPVNDVNVVCEKVISNTGGGAPSGGDDGRNSYMVCETILHWSQYGDSDGNIHMYGFFTTQECTIRTINEYSAAGNDDCSKAEQNKGSVPVVPEQSGVSEKLKKLIKSTNLNQEQLAKLSAALDQIISEDCLYSNIIDGLVDNDFKIDFRIDSSVSGNAGYDPKSKTLSFGSGGTINAFNFSEELVHAYQDMKYSGGTYQYINSAYVNIEFEAKFMMDLIHTKDFDSSQTCCKVEIKNNPALADEYYMWLFSVSNNGQLSVPFSEIKTEYFRFMEGMLGYNKSNALDYNHIPQTLNKITPCN